ncbi:uncharacterized protein LOC143898447 isoform X2 [Temnothorax americanus]|uniref:uncharacterized protein LOC143898447 isoform X2 n=1 Tax=Temnothorax americanus TaxID=1964332 RepID=UPI0040687CF2
MNIHNDMSGIFESPLRHQSEMQSWRKLNESESRPNITLRRMGQELNKAETKCFTLKSELNYVMDVCRKAQTEIRESKETSDISPIISSSKSSGLKSPIKHNGCNSEITDAFNLSPKSARFSPRKSIDDDDIIGRSESLIEERQRGLLNVTITPRTHLYKKLPRSITTMPTQDETTEADREYKSYYFPPSMSFEKLTSQADENYLRVTPCSARRMVEDIEDIEDLGLNLVNLDMPNTAKARRVVKSRSRTGRSEINSVYRMDNSVSKPRKRKAKLRSSVSKSTVTTKDTGFIGRKEAKRRRHRGHQQSNPPKQLKKSNDVVEIFHNTRLKNSNSGVSSKQSKVDEAKYEKKSHLPKTVDRWNQEASVSSPRDRCSKRVNHECQSYDKKNEQAHPQTLNCQNNSGATPEVDAQEQDKSEKHPDNDPLTQDETRQCERAFNRYNDPMFMPSYGMPTLASKLKRSSRSYFSRFNFRNIPFVVGTSVTPSHNLGLNIQQVLSVMKTRQPIASDVTPSLIRKVSRGMRPMSILLNQMNGHYEGSILNVSSQMTGTFNSGENLDRDKRLPVFNLHVRKTPSGCVPKVSTDAEMISEKENNASKQLRKEKGDSCDRRTRQQSSFAVSKSNTLTSPQNQQEISRTLKGNIGDHKIRIPDSHNSKEIRDVLINLHDQFEEINTKYERLQLEVDKSNDKSLAKELSALEKELNAKEEEINAVVGLYKEVMALKRQMKMLHEKNSLVCIATESAKETCEDSFPLSIIPGKSHSMNPTQNFGRRKIYNATREPPASIQLAALLRQIQTFHKQLQLVS